MIDRQIRITGAETIAYECIPRGRGHALLPVHRMLLVDAGIHIIEVLDLSRLAADEVWEFLFVLTPLKVVGATGVPPPKVHSIAPLTILVVTRALKGTLPLSVLTSARSPFFIPRSAASSALISTAGSGLSFTNPSMPWCCERKSV